jgi:hypothetical protein
VALAALCAVLATGCGDEEFTAIGLAIRTDGGSPALTVLAGDLEHNDTYLPPGSYFIEFVNADDDVFRLGETNVEDGDIVGMSPFSGGPNDPELGSAVRTLASFLVDAEIGTLDVMESMSGGFTTTLFDPAAEPTGEDLDALIQSLRDLGAQEDTLMAALYEINDAAVEAREPVALVDARAPSR